jgi:outer membrane protein
MPDLHWRYSLWREQQPYALEHFCLDGDQEAKKKEIKVNGKMLFCRTALVAAGLLLGTAAWAQGGAAPASAASPKVGVVDVRRALLSTAEGKQVLAELQSKYAPRQSELENLSKQISDVQNRLNVGEGKLSEEELSRLRRQGQLLSTQLDRKRNDYQEDLNAEQTDILDRLGRKLLDVVDRYARENGFSLVIDASQNNLVIFASAQIDVTQDIIHLYDQTYPLKAAVTAPPTAQPKPAPARPAQAQPKPQ